LAAKQPLRNDFVTKSHEEHRQLRSLADRSGCWSVVKQLCHGKLFASGSHQRVENFVLYVRPQPPAFARSSYHLVSKLLGRGSYEVPCPEAMVQHDLCDGLLAKIAFNLIIHCL
jgi:hypothetical protein